MGRSRALVASGALQNAALIASERELSTTTGEGPYERNEEDIKPSSPTETMTLLYRNGDIGSPADFAHLRLAEALLRVKREHPQAWKVLWAAGIRLHEENIERLVNERDHPTTGVPP